MQAEIREGQFWKRKLSVFVWKVEAVNPGGTVAIKLWDESPERELLEREEFLREFEPFEPDVFHCPACEGDVTTPHVANCNYANGN